MTLKPPAGADGIPIVRHADETEGRATARAHLRPSVNAGRTLRSVLAEDAPGVALADLADELHLQCAAVVGGNTGRLEALLMCQATTLDAVFNNLLRAAFDNAEHDAGSAERLLRLACRAQAQCAHTIAALAALKNPPMVIANQANIANGPQQVNNGVAHSQETESGPSKLLEQTHARLDPRATSDTARFDSELETVDAIVRAENDEG